MASVKMRVALVIGIGLAAILLAGGPALAATKVNVTLSDIRTTSVQVSWTPTNDSCFKDYRLQYQRTTAAGWSDDVLINSSVTTSYQSVGYTPDISYNFRVVDEDCAGGVEASDPVSFHTLPRASVGEVAAAGISALTLSLIALVAVAVGIGLVVKFAKFGVARVLTRGSRKPLPPPPPTATSPESSVPLPMPSPATGKAVTQGGQRGGTSAPAAAAGPPAAGLRWTACRKCGSQLTSAVCGRCGMKNW